MERRKNYLAILKKQVVLLNVRVFSKHRVTTKIGFQFQVLCGFRLAYKRNSSKNKESESGEIKAIFVHCICCLTCVEKMRAIHFPPKFEWSVLTRTRS